MTPTFLQRRTCRKRTHLTLLAPLPLFLSLNFIGVLVFHSLIVMRWGSEFSLFDNVVFEFKLYWDSS